VAPQRALAVGVPYRQDGFVFSDDPIGSTPWHPDAATSTFRRVAPEALSS
jgi:hypothetical protein